MSSAQTVRIDEGKMVAVVHLVEEDVAGREVAVEKPVVVQACRKAGKPSCDFAALFVGEVHDAVERIAVGRLQADEVDDRREQAFSVAHESHGLWTLEAALAQFERLEISLLAFRCLIDADGQIAAQRKRRVAFAARYGREKSPCLPVQSGSQCE